MSYKIDVTQSERRYLAAVEFTCSVEEMPGHLEEAFGAVLKYLGSIGVAAAPPAVSRYTPPQDGVFGVAAGFYVPSAVDGDGHVVCIELPQVELAHTTHLGPYEDLPQAYNAMFAWMQEHGREPDTIMWEEYHSPPETPPAETRTEVYWPMK